MFSDIYYTEQLIKTMVKEIGIERFMTALHNANAHGDLFEIAGYEHLLDDEDKNLKEWFSHIEALQNILKR